jgi:Ca2+-binding EF-hand superfamily protein
MNILRLSALAAAFTLCAASSAVDAQALPAKAKPASAPAAKQPDLEQGIEQMFAALDKDRNRQVSYEEFKNGVVAERRQMLIIEQLRNKFKAADKNASGGLDAAEFAQLPGLQGLPAPKPVFADHDLNKDKKMDFREYVGFVAKMSAAPAKK